MAARRSTRKRHPLKHRVYVYSPKSRILIGTFDSKSEAEKLAREERRQGRKGHHPGHGVIVQTDRY
jgi:hypothetical protein